MNAREYSVGERRGEQIAVHALILGGENAAVQGAFRRKDEVVRFDVADTPQAAQDMILRQAAVRPFDCVVIDMRRGQGFNPLHVAAIAGMRAVNSVIVLSPPSHVAMFEGLADVDVVLSDPIERLGLIKAILASAPQTHAESELIKIPKSELSKNGDSAPVAYSQTNVSPLRMAQSIMPRVPVLPTGDGSSVSERLAAAQAAFAADRPREEVRPAVQEVGPEKTRLEQARKNADDQDAAKSGNGSAENQTVKQDQSAASVNAGQADATKEEQAATSGETQPASEEEPRRVTPGFESSLSVVQEIDQTTWQYFVPVVNFLYKKLAIVLLTALFLTFLGYGVMIVFFMTMSQWSMPFELSKGHALVERTDRELSVLRVRENQVSKDLTNARIAKAKAERNQADNTLKLGFLKRTVQEEILQQTQRELEIEGQIERLSAVVEDYRKNQAKLGSGKQANKAFSRRLITKRALQNKTLAALDAQHKLAGVTNDVALKRLELQRVEARIAYLDSLLDSFKGGSMDFLVSAGSELAYLAEQVINTRNAIAESEQTLKAVVNDAERLENSLAVVRKTLRSLEATPAARAIDAPVQVMFVPYTNEHKFEVGTRLYGCRFLIFMCSQKGTVGKKVEGETTVIHPLFGKPLRGTFVEATFDDPDSVTQEILHAGRAPVFF